jgi:hypothetical protein
MADLMEYMTKVSNKIKGSGSMEIAIKRCKKLNANHASRFPAYFKEEEMVLLSFFAHLALQDKAGPFLKEIAEYFEMERLKVISLVPFLENLRRKGFLAKSTPHRATVQGLNNCHYYIPSTIMTDISMNTISDPIANLKTISSKQFIQLANNIIQEKQIRDISMEDLIYKINMLAEINEENTLCINFRNLFTGKDGGLNYGKQTHEFIFLLLMLDIIVKGENEINLDDLMEGMDEFNNEFINIIRLYETGKHILLERKFISPIKRSLKKSSKSYELTEEGLNYFLGDETESLIKTSGNLDYLEPNEIEVKNLFFEGEQLAQLNTLNKLLEEGKFEANKTKLTQRFKGNGGIAILLHGAPGTGKTEFVNQLAKQSNRSLLKVDLSNTKSMWYGESEKLTKDIFATYKKTCKKNKNTPILFINEADGLLSKRFQVERSIDQTSNTIQNIILEEIEQFEGILIATTNLMVNLDPAFNRRFLMKIKFDTPGASVREQIWKNVLPELANQQANHLAQTYTLSPAQIDNVAKKLVLKELIGEPTDQAVIINLCEEENGKENKRLGFV